MEFAYDLLENYGSDARARKVVQKSRTIIVPVVNVDGFSISRSASPLGDFSLFDYEMKRKNCSISVNTPARYGRHLQRQPGRAAAGHGPQPQLPRLLGRSGREQQLEQRHLPRRCPGRHP